MIIFTRANKEDAKILSETQIRTFDDNSRRVFNKPFGGPPGYNSLNELEKSIDEDIYFKILNNGKVIGGIHVTNKGNNHYELTRIYVAPEEQNKGIGQKAINFLEEEFLDVSKWTLDTPSVSIRNHYLYEKMGYMKVNEILLDETSSLYLYFYEKTITVPLQKI